MFRSRFRRLFPGNPGVRRKCSRNRRVSERWMRFLAAGRLASGQYASAGPLYGPWTAPTAGFAMRQGPGPGRSPRRSPSEPGLRRRLGPAQSAGAIGRRNRKVAGHHRRLDGAGYGAGDDNFALGRHGIRSLDFFGSLRGLLGSIGYVPISSSARRLCAASAIKRRSRQICRSTSLSADRFLRRSPSIRSMTSPTQSTRRCWEGCIRW